MEIGEDGGEIEQAGKDVLALLYPGNRLDVHRVQRPQSSRQPRPRHGEAAQDAPQQDGVDAVEEDVDGVKPRRVQAPEAELHPEGGEDERIVLR
jgi:hypothetical protein